jgi:Bacterial dnaA protein helix-turn-helix
MSNLVRVRPYLEDAVEFERKRNMVCSRRLLEALAIYHGDGSFELPEDPLDPEPPPEDPPKPVVFALPPIPNTDIAAAAEVAFPTISMGRIEAIQRATLTEFKRIRLVDLKAPRRTAVIVRARQIAMYLAKELTSMSLPEIGRRFGGRDHTTVMHAHRKIGALIEVDAALAAQVDRIKTVLPEFDFEP